jgi:hypothetical protein
MAESRFRFGVFVSFAWLIAAAALLFWKWPDFQSMPPNAWGDFFAGCFAPLAFLWLVLGYLQQGEELRLSTKALQLQAEELRNSVRQQQALVEVSRQQVESEREALLYERQVREEAVKPKFSVRPAGGTFHGNGESNYNLVILNSGRTATDVHVNLALEDGKVLRLLDAPLFEEERQHQTSFAVSGHLPPGEHVLSIKFTDPLGRPGEVKFAVSRQSEDKHSELKFLQA